MSVWTISVSHTGEDPAPFTEVSMEDDRDVYRCLIAFLIDIQERYEDPALFVNGKKFRPKEEDVQDYYQYLIDVSEGKKPEKPIVSVACMRRYADDIAEHTRDLKEQAEQIVERVHRPKGTVKVKIR